MHIDTNHKRSRYPNAEADTQIRSARSIHPLRDTQPRTAHTQTQSHRQPQSVRANQTAGHRQQTVTLLNNEAYWAAAALWQLNIDTNTAAGCQNSIQSQIMLLLPITTQQRAIFSQLPVALPVASPPALSQIYSWTCPSCQTASPPGCQTAV